MKKLIILFMILIPAVCAGDTYIDGKLKTDMILEEVQEEVIETEKHLHNREKSFGAAASATAETKSSGRMILLWKLEKLISTVIGYL